jgi:hypothetical protein
MKIFIICSKVFYDRIPEIKIQLEQSGHIITLPNSYDNPQMEDYQRSLGSEIHSRWKSEMIRHSSDVIQDMDAVLVLNFDKNGILNYIGGATFLEMYDAFKLNKKIFLFNDIPEGILKDEIIGFRPVVIDSNLSEVK